MARIFNSIRQRLLKENRLTRYLVYAVGEIVLVVVGILIALQVNNWNQEARDHRAGADLLHRIQHDLVQDTTNFRKVIERNDVLRAEIKELLVTLYAGVDSIEQVKRMSDIYDRALDQTFSPNDRTYKSMVSSGNLGFIGNNELKDEIMDLYAEYDQSAALLSSIGDWMINVASNVDTETDFLKFNGTISDIFTTKEMLNVDDFAFMNEKEDRRFKILIRAISGAAFNQKVNSKFHAHLIDRCAVVLQHIDEDLKKAR